MGLLYERAVSQRGLETDYNVLAFLWPTVSPLACFQDFLLQHTVTCGEDTVKQTHSITPTRGISRKGTGEGFLVLSFGHG